MRQLQVFGLLASAFAFLGCVSGSNGLPGAAAAVDVTVVDPGTDCPSGGERVKIGTDANRDGVLDDKEVSKTYLTCNGAGSTGSGASLVVTEPEPPGKHCKAGGVAIESGADSDGDGQLSAQEVQNTEYVCTAENGSDGSDGAVGERGAEGPAGDNGQDGQDGKPGKDGLSSLIATSVEPPGSHCVSGGALIAGGVDANGNGVLDASEVSSTAYVCNGGTSLVRTSFESPGTNCLHGGFRVDSGADTDFDGTLSDPEVKTTNYVCNGANGLNGGIDGMSSLVRTVTEPAGPHCGSGGVRIDMGIDDNENTVLDPSEVDSSSYVCTGSSGLNGTDGSNGANGANGLDGALSLVRMSAEPIGTHCPTGGVKVDTGVDDNHDAVLDTGEIDATSYVCNGIAGLAGANGSLTLLKTTLEPPGANCTTGGFKLTSGADSNGNGTLDNAEVTNTSYVCNGLTGLTGLNGLNGINGSNALSSLTKTVVELPGANCAAGGFKISNGTDSNGNGVLDSSEATGNNYLCNGLAGSNGVNGLTNLVKTAVELPGSNCATGGLKLATGADSNGNGVLDSVEVTGSSYVCNGLNGLAGLNGSSGTNGLSTLTKTAVELPGTNCATGGFKVSTGTDNNGNSVLDASEATSSNYICNGLNGLAGLNGSSGAASLVNTAVELPGVHCAAGGFKVTTGTDANANAVLDVGEVSATNYLCNGINGLAGAAGLNGSNGTSGSNGSNGLGSLVNTVVEAPGTNCLLGGVKINSGIDTNKNGTLDASEITSSSYACNGQTGATGAAGTTGASSLVKTSIELPLAGHCTLGGLRVDSGLDTNHSGVLDTGEITNTSYLCTLQST